VLVRRLSWTPAVVALAGIAFLVYRTSTARPLWVDEESLLLNVRDRGFLGLAGPLWLDQSAPLAWLVLERAVLVFFGSSEPALRSVTVAFGAGTLLTAVWIGRRWMSVTGAVVFVTLCAAAEWPVFFTLELKHYSADMFGSLLVPAVAARALDARFRPIELRRRVLQWWLLAAAAQWFSNGALFVTPLCAVVMVALTIRPASRLKSVLPVIVAGFAVWLVSFGANYALVLRHASANSYLRNYWAFAFPPVSKGLAETASWVVGQLEPFAVKPGSSGHPFLFWLVWASGLAFAIGSRRSHAAFVATVPFAALALALLHIVPPFERLAMWVVPSIYAGIGYGADAGFALATARFGRSRLISLGLAAAAVAVVGTLAGDIARRGLNALAYRPRSNYGLDDRSSIRWLLANHRAGDAVLTTHYGLVALWWYGAIPVGGPDRGGSLEDGSPVFELTHAPARRDCGEWRNRTDAALGDRTRAAAYLGFRMNVAPVGFDNLVLDELARRGQLEAYKEYAEVSRLAIFDLAATATGPVILPHQQERFPVTARGCVRIVRAARW
jgi:hypothetical protein